METGRNEPCPCGSGRKYKACCMAADQSLVRAGVVPLSGAEARAYDVGRQAGRVHDTWQVDVVPLNVGLNDREGAPSLGMAVAGGFVVHVEVLAQRPAGASARAAALADQVSAAGRAVGVLPARVVVRDPDEVELLAASLAARGIVVEAGPVGELDEALDGALAHMSGSALGARLTAPDTWAETGCTPEELRELHEAAAEFYSAAPWEELADVDIVIIRSPDGSTWAASVLGGGGIEYGVALYSDPADLARMVAADEPGPEMMEDLQGYILNLSFEPRSGVSRPIQRELARARWPVAGPDAHPRMYGVHVPERRVTAEHVRRMARVLRAVRMAAGGADPEPSTGLAVMVVHGAGNASPWPLPERAGPVVAEGPGADPQIRLWDETVAATVLADEQARYERLQAWLRRQKLPASARSAAERNGQCWGDFLVNLKLPAGAVTEFDLRVFLYRYYPLAADTTQAATRDLLRSMRLIFRFLDAREGIRYPFGEPVLAELETLARAGRAQGVLMEEVLAELSEHVRDDLEMRGLMFDMEVPGTEQGWSDSAADPALAALASELERRWLLWYDEQVRVGSTDLGSLMEVLVARQREWEATPHPRTGGRTPAQAVKDHEAQIREAEAG